MAGSFNSAFSSAYSLAFGIGNKITASNDIQFPVNCVLIGHQETILDRYRVNDIRPMNIRIVSRLTRGT